MQDGTWGQALSELTATIAQALIRLLKQDFVQVGLAIGMFLALALPLLLVIALLWYIDASGWRPEGGFYKIGASAKDATLLATAYAAAIGIAVPRGRSIHPRRAEL
jgi:hypothetical protein